MKQLFLSIALAMTGVSYAQWNTEYYVDEFGEKTNETFEYFDVVGVFTNSATTNSDCGFFVKHDGNEGSYTISIYPYNRDSRESWTSNTFQDIKLKKPSGDVETLSGFCYKKGQVLFSEEDYPIFKDAISQSGDYTFLLKYNGKYSESSYKFKFTID
jgi:hypothetical protein